MADQYAYPGMQQPGQAGAYPQFHYPNAGGDQNAQLLSGYGLPQQALSNMNTGAYSQPSSAQGMGNGSQVPLQAGFGYPDFSAFNQYAGMNQNMQAGLAAVQPGLGGDMQQFGPLMANAFGQQLSSNGEILEAIAQQQGLPGLNPAAFLQDPTGRGAGIMNRGGQRGGFNKFGGMRTNSNLPSVMNPDGLREDTVFVSNLPQTIDHETMKAQFGVVGKIKINNKSGMPMVWIFKEKGVPKGEALVTYEEPKCVQAAIKWFSENDFMGRKVEVKQATNSQRPVIIPPGWGGAKAYADAMFGGTVGPNPNNNTAAALAAATIAAAASGNTLASLVHNSPAAAANFASLTGNPTSQFDDRDYNMDGRGGSANRGGHGGMLNGRMGGTGSSQAGSREGDWSCAQCGNVNFSWREQCNRCHVHRAADGPMGVDMGGRPSMGPMGRGGMHGTMPTMNPIQHPGMPGFGRGGPIGSPLQGSGRGIARGGGPMRGGVGVGRARPAPY